MKYYFIGIKGAGMSTLANILYDLGNSIIGYDDCDLYKFTMKGLDSRGIKVYTGSNLPKLDKNTIVTYTAAININHHELKRVSELGLKIIPYHELIGSLTKKMDSICVCGTHGKTTTSLMISKILNSTIGCNYFVGDGSGHGDKNSKLFVLESCEYNKHFLSYFPNKVVITNIELDHTETYPTIEKMIDAYQEFVNKCSDYVIACGDDKNICKLNIKKCYYYGFGSNNSLVIRNRHVLDNKTLIDVYFEDKYYDSYRLPFFGDHLVKDAMAAVMVSILYDIPKVIVKDILENYEPAVRRFNETIINNHIIIDDYAHHPTEIKVTYDSAHQKYPKKEIIAVFLPNTYSRTQALFNDFCEALRIYDKAYLMDIKCDREQKSDYPNISSSKLVDNIKNSELIDLNTCNKLLNHHNAVICFMSCANITPMIDEYKRILKK